MLWIDSCMRGCCPSWAAYYMRQSFGRCLFWFLWGCGSWRRVFWSMVWKIRSSNGVEGWMRLVHLGGIGHGRTWGRLLCHSGSLFGKYQSVRVGRRVQTAGEGSLVGIRVWWDGWRSWWGVCHGHLHHWQECRCGDSYPIPYRLGLWVAGQKGTGYKDKGWAVSRIGWSWCCLCGSRW